MYEPQETQDAGKQETENALMRKLILVDAEHVVV